MRAEYYTQVLYPIQDKVITVFRDSPFYLTGGTALSRGYYNHRYSEDLDYFVNDHPDFQRITKKQIEKLTLIFPDLEIDQEEINVARVFVEKNNLKIELINDVPSHIGKLVDHPVLGIVDSKDNILANKLTALIGREEPKDMVDIFFLLRDGLDIKKALLDADSKAAGISPPFIAKLLTDFDYGLIEQNINWVKPVSTEEIKEYFKDVTHDIIYGQEQDKHPEQDVEHKGRHR